MSAEELAGPPGPKITRLLYFVGAAIIFTVTINKWTAYEKQSNEKHQTSQQNRSHKAVE